MRAVGASVWSNVGNGDVDSSSFQSATGWLARWLAESTGTATAGGSSVSSMNITGSVATDPSQGYLFEPGGYAIVGAAAASAAITGKISIGVVIFELTSQLS